MTRVDCIKNGAYCSFKAKPEITIDRLQQWQEENIGHNGFSSISIVIDGAIYSTLEA